MDDGLWVDVGEELGDELQTVPDKFSLNHPRLPNSRKGSLHFDMISSLHFNDIHLYMIKFYK